MPYRNAGPRRYVSPLLPFERELIELLGLSEEEYHFFQEQARSRSGLRPAEYEHIPDIRCDPVSVLVSLAIGIALTAASYLLAPKPKQVAPQAQQKGIESKQLRDITGQSRFDQSAGFDGSAQLAEYGTLVAILFGMATAKTGGLIAKPSLVWSRMFSFGRSQGFKGVYVVGEGVLNAPEISGIYLGTNALNPVMDQHYGVFWTKQEGSNRIGMSDQIAGKLEPAPLMGSVNGQFATCPTVDGANEPGFCSVITPSNNQEFGGYAPILNGTAVRYNWRAVSSPIDGGDAGKMRLYAERKKIGGEYGQGDGMPGDGRGYSPLMALIRHNGTEYRSRTIVDVNVGDTVVFRISGESYPEEIGDGVTLQDMNDRLTRARENADDALQLGELFLISRTIWKVTNRPNQQWRIDRGTQDYTLECIEVLLGVPKIGIGGTDNARVNYPYEGDVYKDFWCGPSFFPLLRYALATYRNSRPTEATEFGIRSRVYQRASGLCNFKEAPSREELVSYDRSNIQLSGGTMSTYLSRASCFTILLRPAGLREDGKVYPWARLNEQFVVIGNDPIDQYNFIRIKGVKAQELEFRFIPKVGADVAQFSPPDTTHMQLNANSGQEIGANYDTEYGTFRVSTIGSLMPVSQFLSLDEMQSKWTTPVPGYSYGKVRDIEMVELLPTYITVGKTWNYCSALLGEPGAFQNRNQTKTHSYSISNPGESRGISLRIQATSYQDPFGPYADSGGWYWKDLVFTAFDNNGSFQVGDRIVDTRRYRFDVSAVFRVSNVETVWVPPVPSTPNRAFEMRTQIADVSHYAELEKSNSDSPEFLITYVNESFKEEPSPPHYGRLAMLGLSLRSSKGFSTIEQPNCWVPNGLSVKRFGSKHNGAIGPSNRFCDLVYHLLTDPLVGSGDYVSAEMVDQEGFHRTANFLDFYNLCWDGVISSKINIREFCATNAPMSLCSFVIRNGRFTIEPALPTNDNGELVTGRVPVAQIFSAGNIIEDSFSLEYLESQDRETFAAIMSYRQGARHELPREYSFKVLWADVPDQAHEQRAFDLTQFCTSREQAFMVARYMLSVERRVDHSITFKTTPQQASVAPGAFIKVITEASPYRTYQNAVILDDGHITSLSPLVDGDYEVDLYVKGGEEVQTLTLHVEDQQVADPALHGAIFTVRDVSYGANLYQVEQVTFDEDGLIEIKASIHPTDNDGASLIVRDVLTASNFILEN